MHPTTTPTSASDQPADGEATDEAVTDPVVTDPVVGGPGAAGTGPTVEVEPETVASSPVDEREHPTGEHQVPRALVVPGAPAPPVPRGELSAAVLAALAAGPDRGAAELPSALPCEIGAADPYGDDVQLALYICYELHHHGFRGVDSAWEWHADLLHLRAALEGGFLAALAADTNTAVPVGAALAALLVEPLDGDGLTHHLLREGTLEQLREHVILHSAYHLGDADPRDHWLTPSLPGETADGPAEAYAALMRGLGLDPRYGGHLDEVPAQILATVNLRSMLGLHRAQRAALLGHLAAVGVSAAPSADRMARALDRLGVSDPACAHFYTRHVAANSVHEQLIGRAAISRLLTEDPDAEPGIVFGVQATRLLDQRLTEYVLPAWRGGGSALRG